MLGKRPDNIAVWTDEGRDDAAAEVTLATGEPGKLKIAVSAPKASLAFIALRWKMPIPKGTRILGDHWERGYGDLEWRGFVPERTLPWYALLHHPKTGDSLGFGAETGAAAFASWRVDEAGVTLVLDVRCGGRGVRLGDRTLAVATTYSASSLPGERPFAFAQRFCQDLCPAPRLTERPVYGGNDWYFRYGNITAETVKRDSSFIRDLAPNVDNPPHFVIDAGWFPARDCNGGPYDRGYEGFPDMPGLAEWMKGIGVQPGIWIRPLLTSEAVPDSWRFQAGHPHAREEAAYLDPSVPEVLERVRTDIRRLTDWGYRLIKFDFTTFDITGRWGFMMGPEITPGGWSFADRSRTTAEIVRAFYAAIREAAGDAVLIGCNAVGHLGAGLFELQRTGDDTSGRDWERTRKMGVNALAFRMPQHGAFFAADADCVGMTESIPWESNRLWLDLVSRSGTPLFVSASADAVDAEKRAALKAAFERAAIPAPPGEPLDWMETTCPRRWKLGGETAEYDWVRFDESIFACP